MTTSVEMRVMAAEELKDASLVGKMSTYAVAWVNAFDKHSTRIARKSGKSPLWNHAMSIPIDASALSNPYACLTLQVHSRGPVRDTLLGTAWLPLREIARRGALGLQGEEPDIVTLQLQRPSGRMQGIVRVSIRLVGDAAPAGLSHPQLAAPTNKSFFFQQQPAETTTTGPTSMLQSSAIAPVEGIPVMGYSPAGSAYYHQHIPSPPPGYAYPSAPPIPAVPQQRRQSNMLLGVLGGVLGALLLADLFY